MTEKENLIAWIHRAETPLKESHNNLGKRLDAIVIEIFFENYLLRSRVLPWPKLLSFGWAYGYADYQRRHKRWFKVSEGSGQGKVVSREFARQTLSAYPEDQLFLLQPGVSLSGPLPEISWNVTEIVLNSENRLEMKHSSAAKKIESQLTKNTTAALERRIEAQPNDTISNWLSHESTRELERLFSTRCLMNFGEQYLTDIDAVGLDDDGELEIIEFKRKDPAKGKKYKPVFNTENPPPSLEQYFSIIDSLESAPENFEIELNNTRNWEYHRTPSFGLDSSHLRTLQLCLAAKIRYRYAIWNSSIKKPSELLSFDFEPLNSIDICSCHLTASCFTGISFTKGKDSGSYTPRPRFQLMTRWSQGPSATTEIECCHENLYAFNH